MYHKGYGLIELVENEWRHVPGSEDFASINIRSICAFEGDTLLLIGGSRGLYLFHDGQHERFQLSDRGLDEELYIVTGTLLPNGWLALATRFGGLLIVDREGTILRRVDISSGLPDNRMLGEPFLDRQGGLWLPLDYGLARVEVFSEQEYFDRDNGFQGSPQCIAFFDGTHFIGTSQGVYRMTPPESQGMPSSFAFIDGTEGRNWDLVSTHDRLFIANAMGLMSLQRGREQARYLVENTPLFSLGITADSSRLLVGTYGDGLLLFEKHGNTWQQEGRFSHVSSSIRKIHRSEANEFWLSVNDHGLERLTFDANSSTAGDILSNSEVVSFDSAQGLPHPQVMYPVSFRGELLVATTDGWFRFVGTENRFEPATEFMDRIGIHNRGVYRPHVDLQERLWFDISELNEGAAVAEGDSMHLITPFARTGEEVFYSFFSDPSGVVWAGGADGRLHRWEEKDYPEFEIDHHALVRAVLREDESVIFGGFLTSQWVTPVLKFHENALRILYALPQYNAPDHNEFQYRLVGLNHNWSNWRREYFRDFTNLGPGRYTFEVRARDICGHISEAGTFEFRILPPWYRTFPAYFVYILLLLGLIYLIVRIRLHNYEVREQQLEQIVTEKTRDLRESEEQYRMMFANSPLGVVHYRKDGVILDCNARFLSIVGQSRAELEGKKITAVLSQKDLQPMLQASLEGEDVRYEGSLHVNGDIRTIPARALFNPILSEEGELLSILGIIEDETERRRSAEIEIEAKQMKVANQLVATIAHEFNNPLAIIKGISDIIAKPDIPDEDKKRMLGKIPHQVDRMSDLVRKLVMLRELREVDYASGIKMLDIHLAESEKQPPHDPGEDLD